MSYISRNLMPYDPSEYSVPEAEAETPNGPIKTEEGEDTGAKIEDVINSEGTTSITNKEGQLGKNDFMKLLLAQIKYQDPLSPMDNTESIAQMAQFSSLEQMEQLNSSFESMMKMQQASGITESAQFIGKNALVYMEEGLFAGEVKTAYQEDGEVKLRLVGEEGQEHIAGINELAMVEDADETDSKIKALMEYQPNETDTESNTEEA